MPGLQSLPASPKCWHSHNLDGGMRRLIKWTDGMHKLGITLLTLAVFPMTARSAAPTAEACRTMPAKRIPAEIMTNSFLKAHQDLQWRSIALAAYKKRDFAKALNDFRRAARYAGKFSQSMVAICIGMEKELALIVRLDTPRPPPFPAPPASARRQFAPR